jgi:hypothetical protein
MPDFRKRTNQTIQRLAFGLALILLVCASAEAAFLPLGVEQDAWSDMAFASVQSGSYNSTSDAFALSAAPSNDLELGLEFGPSNAGKHYGNGGTWGGPSPGFSATLTVTGTTIAPTADDLGTPLVDESKYGTITNGGLVRVVYNGPAANGTNMASDYGGLVNGSVLLEGTVIEALLDATGDNTLDVLVHLSSGILQTPGANLNHDAPVFARNGRGILRISGVTMPSNWTSGFNLTPGGKINFLGIPEPGTMMLALLGAIFACITGSRRDRHERIAR